VGVHAEHSIWTQSAGIPEGGFILLATFKGGVALQHPCQRDLKMAAALAAQTCKSKCLSP